MIGTRAEAQAALDTYYDLPTDIEMSFLGAGSYRNVYLGPSGAAYKVGCGLSNRDEVSVSRQNKTRKDLERMGVFMPRFSAYRVSMNRIKGHRPYLSNYVSAVEYVDIDDSRKFFCESTYGFSCSCTENVCLNDFAERIIRVSGITDLHDENVVYDTDGRLWILDLNL